MRRPRSPHLLFVATVCFGCAAARSDPAVAAAPSAPDEARDLVLLPPNSIYEPYIADPRRSVTGLTSVKTSGSRIADTGSSRYGIRMGGRFGLVRWPLDGEADQAVQLDVDIGFLSQFDRDRSADIIGWDGLYGVYLSWLPREDLGLRFGFSHDSSHVGDEYIESTGRRRIGYTRQEALLGVSWKPASIWRTYAEYGYAFDRGNEELMREGRFQFGVEVAPEPLWWKEQIGWYLAGDASAFEEDNWSYNFTAQGGIAIYSGTSTLRLGLEYYNGRSAIGEFFQDQEEHFAYGFWFDI